MSQPLCPLDTAFPKRQFGLTAFDLISIAGMLDPLAEQARQVDRGNTIALAQRHGDDRQQVAQSKRPPSTASQWAAASAHGT